MPRLPIEPPSQLFKLAPGPWISLGGFLDYEHWPDRDRFKELDEEISLGPTQLHALRRRRRVLELRRGGKSVPAIARRFGLPVQRIEHILKRYGDDQKVVAA